MQVSSGKKFTVLYILQILRENTDIYHPMTQQEIRNRLLEDYGIEISRTTMARTIADLIEENEHVDCNPVSRSYTDRATGEKEDSSMNTGIYYVHDFTQPELHMLIDGLLFSRSVPYKYRKDLIRKLGELSSSHFSKRMEHVHSMSADAPQNDVLFVNIEELDEAIQEGKQVEIVYGYFGTDMKLHPTLNEDGTEKKQILNPYQLVASEGKYYLICNKDNKETVANYRIDRMMRVKKLDTPSRPKSQVAGLENGLKTEQYLYQHVNMFSGEPENVEFIIPKSFVSVVIDFFGKHVSFFDRGDGTISCHLEVSREAMRHWAGQFADVVRVVSPESLVEEIREDIRKACVNYGIG